MSHLGPESIPGGRIVDVKCEWWDGEGQIILIWGILNPNGPTLYVLGSRKFDGKQRIFFRWMHMLGGCTTYAARPVESITYQGIYEDAESIHRHLVREGEQGLFHVIPCFLYGHGNDALARIAKRLLSNGAAASANSGRHMAYVRQFGSNFFAMAGAEIRDTYESMLAEARTKREEPSEFLKMTEMRYGHIPDFKDAKIPSWTEAPMTPDLLEEWWRIVGSVEYSGLALGAMTSMWKGASTMLSDDMKATLVPWDSIIGFLGRYGLKLAD